MIPNFRDNREAPVGLLLHFNLLWCGRGHRSREKDSHAKYRKYQEHDKKYDENVGTFMRIEYAVGNVEYLIEYPRISRLPIFFSHWISVANPKRIAQRFCTHRSFLKHV